MNVAIVFARGPEKSRRNVNLYRVDGRPLISFSIDAALKSPSIHRVYVCTDDAETAEIAQGMSCETIPRPPETAGAEVGGAIHAAGQVVLERHPALTNLAILSGNTSMISSYLIEKSLDLFYRRPAARSLLTVWQARHDHPYYAFSRTGQGLAPLLSERDEKPVYFFDGCLCLIRREVIGHSCFGNHRWWLGLPDCVLLVRPWPTGRDVHDSYGLALARWWTENALIDIAQEDTQWDEK